MAVWEEAEYWQTWAGRSGLLLPREALLWGHPRRPDIEIRVLVRWLQAVHQLQIQQPTAAEIGTARRFMTRRGVTP
jgi:hypothetical protein